MEGGLRTEQGRVPLLGTTAEWLNQSGVLGWRPLYGEVPTSCPGRHQNLGCTGQPEGCGGPCQGKAPTGGRILGPSGETSGLIRRNGRVVQGANGRANPQSCGNHLPLGISN